MAPIDDAVDSFTGITSLPRANAIEWLKLNSNDVERAVNAWMDNPVPWPPKPPAFSWDEAPFHSDKSGDGPQNTPSFNVHAPDTLTPGVFAPSRPPSRTEHSGAAAAAAQGRQRYPESEDEQVNRAVAMSLSESQTLPGQETGVTNYGQISFGPAQRDDYAGSQWAMVLPGAQAQEVPLDPEPFDRKRQPGAPAFVKPTPDLYRLSALIKILHEIPLARKALLNESQAIPDYGQNSEWWNGAPIKILKVVNLDQDQLASLAQDMIYETQRLMAFLDRTERAYGSAEVLAGLQGWGIGKEHRVSRFLTEWRESTKMIAGEEPLTDIFQSRGIKRDLEDDKCLMDEKFSCLNVRVEQHLTDVGMSLYDALDELMWTDSEKNEVFLTDVAEVFTFEVTNLKASGSGLGIDIPATWYLDRYLESSTLKAREMLRQKTAVYEQLEELDRRQEKLIRYHKQTTSAIEGSALLSKTIAYFEDTSLYRSNTIRTTDDDQMVPETGADVLQELKMLSDRIASKLAAFERGKESAREHLREISQFFTKTTDESDTSPNHKYTLRGVSTTPQTMYVLEKTQPEDEDDVLSSDAKDWQWWKIEFLGSDQKHVLTTKVTEETVLLGARTESSSTLLVYASERAVEQSEPPRLIKQLENFVRADNLHFSAELEQSDPTTHLSPGKRKATDSDSDDLITHQPQTPPNLDDLEPIPDGDSPPYQDHSSAFSLPQPRIPRPIRPKVSESRQLTDEAVLIQSPERSNSDLQQVTVNMEDADRPESADHYSNNHNKPQGQEMEERKAIRRKPVNLGGIGRGKGPPQEQYGYKLGSYTPEISMDDEDDDDDNEEEEEGGGGEDEKAQMESQTPNTYTPMPKIDEADRTRDDQW